MAEHSVLIVGGGPVGLAVAALLCRRPHADRWRIRLLEPRPAPQWSAEALDLRVYALSRASQHILQSAGVWHALEQRRVSPYRRMVVWEGAYGAATGQLTFDCAELAEPDLGHIIEDRLLRACLVDQLRGQANVELSFGVELATIDRQSGSIVVTTQDDQTVEAAVLIAADGSASAVRTQLELPTVSLPYGQDAVVAHVRTEKSHAQTAWQRFLRTGPVALLPLDDGRSSVVWSMPSASAEKLLHCSDAHFSAELAAATDHLLGRVTEVGDRASFPLRAVHARQYCSARAALLGDAAHTVHPLAGQGMNLGLLDAAALVAELEAAARAGEDPGDWRVLRRYERRQKGKNVKTLLTLDVLHRLFTRAGPLLAPVRATGLTLVDALPAAKRALMREALGLTGELPDAAQARW